MKFLPINLKYLRKQKRLSQKEVAEILGIGTTAYGAYERGDNEPPLSKVKILCNLYDNVLYDDLFGKNLNIEKRSASAIDLNDFNAIQIKVVDFRVQAGYLTNFDNLDFRDGLDSITVPHFGLGRHKELLAFEVEGDSMLPRIEQGDYVVCRKFTRDGDLSFYINKKFVINTGEELLVKRLKSFDSQTKDSIFSSDNHLNYPEININISKIEELWKVEHIWAAEA